MILQAENNTGTEPQLEYNYVPNIRQSNIHQPTPSTATKSKGRLSRQRLYTRLRGPRKLGG